MCSAEEIQVNNTGFSFPARLAVFGPPLLLEGEDAAAYDALCARICAAVKPVNTIEEIFVNGLIALQWEILRWRRLSWSLVRACGLEKPLV